MNDMKEMWRLAFWMGLWVGVFARASFGITASELAETCRTMEDAITDVKVEFEWSVDPAPTLKDIEGTDQGIVKGPRKCIWMTKRPFEDRSLCVTTQTIMNSQGESLESRQTESFDGTVARLMTIDVMSGKDISTGTISKSRRFTEPMNCKPLAFSVLRLVLAESEKVPLSERLRKSDFVRMSDSTEKINGFDAIGVDLLRDLPNIPAVHKQPYMRVYIAVDHGYTPVRYLSYSPGPGGTGLQVNYQVDVLALERCSDRLWFPSAGRSGSPQNHLTNIYKATKITLNQGLRDEDFTFEFPAGTRVDDETSGVSYVADAAQSQVNPPVGSQPGTPEDRHGIARVLYVIIGMVCVVALVVLSRRRL